MDVVVTLPTSFGIKAWVDEGDPAGAPWSGQEWGWFMGGRVPPKRLDRGDRVYVTYRGKLIGYSPLIRVQYRPEGWGFALVRGGNAVAVTIPEAIKPFRGYRYRWWEREIEVPFPDWKEAFE
jgi:hypothetical protein